ncbi:hypothetical protein ABFA07_020007 [Porites harrisoni]
MLKRYV